jgi:hypothetical protein
MLKLLKHSANIAISTFRTIIYKKKRSGKWSTVEKHFKERHPCCEICGSQKNLQVHHIKPFHLYPELELEESNLITLCMSRQECHLLIAHCGSFKKYNPKLKDHVEILQKDMSQFNKIAEEAKKIALTE